MRSEYVPMRDISSRVVLGMNQLQSGKRFGRMSEAFRSEAAYWGEHGRWYIVAAQTRDSDALDRSNFIVFLKELGGESETVKVEEASHWACGWVQYLIVAPTDRKALRTAVSLHCSACNYPVLDESHFSELEYDEAYEWAERELGEFDGWEEAFRNATDNTGFSDDEAGRAIEEARTYLEGIADGSITPPEKPDPNQLSLF